MPNEPSKLLQFVQRLYAMESRLRHLKSHSINVGWANESKEQNRAMAKGKALAINADRKSRGLKGKGEIVSNFDENFIGPGLKAASLAVIARTMNYGRAGGVNKKTGRPYGAIPARPFVDVLKRKHITPLERVIMDQVVNLQNPSPEANLVTIGVVAKGQLQRAMKDSNSYAANAPITVKGGWMANPKNGKPFKIEPKGSSRPLWNTGTLIKSVDFEIK